MVVDKNGDVLNERCIFGIHVHKAAKVTGWVHLALQFVFLVYSITIVTMYFTTHKASFDSNMDINEITDLFKNENKRQDQAVHEIFGIIFAIIAIGTNVLFLYAITHREPTYYWPFLFVTAIGSAMCVILIVMTPFNTISIVNASNQAVPLLKMLLIVLINIVVILCCAAYIYFCFVVVNQSRRVMYAEVAEGDPKEVESQPKRTTPIQRDPGLTFYSQ